MTQTIPQSVSFAQTVTVSPQLVHKALTNKMLIRQWLCDNAAVEGNNNFLFNWNDGDAVFGEMTSTDKERVEWTWQPKGKGSVSRLSFTLTALDGGAKVEGTHSELSDEDVEKYTQFWEGAMEQLKVALESGEDIRLTRRPMLGIFPSPLEETKAQRLGIPVSKGVFIDNVIEGKSAQAAGIQSGDVIVSIDGKPVWDFPTLISAIGRHKVGHTVTVEFYRGAEKQTKEMPLSGRDKLNPPTTPAALAEFIQARYAELDAELDKIVLDVPEDGMEHVSAEGEWSANEVLAHLIFTERFYHMYIWGAVSGDDAIAWVDNNVTQRAGIMAEYTTGAELVALFKRSEAETVDCVLSIPASFVADRASFARVAEVMMNLHDHTWEHFGQIRASIKDWTETAVVAG